ncbi:MAG: amidohydrolase 2 [Actinomycetia bacterium]|nr:amidohydrolase 2 [Actinomycetes bacterium]
MSDRYAVISSDCHGGAQLLEYRDYLPSSLYDEFDVWARDFAIPFEDLRGPDADQNWDSARRLKDMDDEGVAGEVIYPNTIPPFFPKGSLVGQPPAKSRHELDMRWIGLQAHNRWLADFVAEAPERRAGIAQIMLHDVDAAVEEVRWAKEHGLRGGVLLPGTPPGGDYEPHWSPIYEPLWQVCEELEMPVNHHGGGGGPYYGEEEISYVMFVLEVPWFAHRAMWALMFSGVLERHPNMQLIFTEQGTAWVPERLKELDHFYYRMRDVSTGAQESAWGGPVRKLSLSPSEYWERQCHIGASFLRPSEAKLRHEVGIDRVMWGTDYPHLEGTQPYTREALRATFHDVPEAEVRAIVGGNAAKLYDFDLKALQPLVDQIGPTPAEIAIPLDKLPVGGLKCPAFDDWHKEQLAAL